MFLPNVTATAVLLCTALCAGGAVAQTTPGHPKPPKAVVKKGVRAAPLVTAAAATATSAHPTTPLAPLSEAELAVVPQVYVGELPCELGQRVHLQPDPANPGYFYLQVKHQRFHLRPVATSTGAVRLEDSVQGAVWLQLANKSMLMNQKLGRRMADECMSPVQQAMTEHLKHNPAPHLLDVAQTPR